MRILHAAIFNEERCGRSFYSIDYKLTRALTRLGHYVMPFSYRDIARRANPIRIKKLGIREMNRRLVKTARLLRPELLLIGKGELIRPSTVAEIREALPGIRVGLWTCDTLYDLDQHFAAMGPQVDAVFSSMTGAVTRRMAKEGGAPYYFLPNPVDPEVERPAAADAGTGPSLLWVGGIADEPLRLRFVEWVQRYPESAVYACLGQQKVYGAKYLELLSQARIVTGYARLHEIPWYTSDRMSNAMGCGAFYMTRRFEGIEDFFDKGVHCEWFDTLQEAQELADRYLADNALRQKVAAAGRERVFELFDHMTVAQHLLDVIFDGNDSRYRVPKTRATQGPEYVTPIVQGGPRRRRSRGAIG